MATRLNFASVDFSELFERLISSKRESGSDIRDAVAAIIEDIRGCGDDALLALTAKYDGLAVGSVAELAIPDGELQAALNGLDDDLRQSLELAGTCIQAFHENQRPMASPTPMQLGCDLQCDIHRLTRSVFMCPAERRLIRPRS